MIYHEFDILIVQIMLFEITLKPTPVDNGITYNILYNNNPLSRSIKKAIL